MKLTILLPILAAALPLAATAQTTTKLTASKANEYGLVYTLPLNGFDVTVAARKTVRTPGQFANYARKYLNADPILNASVKWEIDETVVTETAYADETERYLVTLKGGSGVYIRVSDETFPMAINTDAVSEIDELDLPEAVKAEPTILESNVARQAMTSEMVQSTSSAKRAELAAAKIYELRQSRNDIISGQADAMPSDGAAMKLALERIAEQEEALTAMFLGTVQTSVEVRTYHVVIPEGTEGGRQVIGRLSATDGLVGPDDLSGAPIYFTIKPITIAEMPVNEKGVTKTFPKGGVAYRIPGQAEVTVSYDGETLVRGRFDVAQYGVTFGLDPSLFTVKRDASYLIFNPITGGIRELGTLSE